MHLTYLCGTYSVTCEEPHENNPLYLNNVSQQTSVVRKGTKVVCVIQPHSIHLNCRQMYTEAHFFQFFAVISNKSMLINSISVHKLVWLCNTRCSNFLKHTWPAQFENLWFSFTSSRPLVVKLQKNPEVTCQIMFILSGLQYILLKEMLSLWANQELSTLLKGTMEMWDLRSSSVHRSALPQFASSEFFFNHHSTPQTELDLLWRCSSLTFALFCLLWISAVTLQKPRVTVQCPLVCTL